MAGGFSQITNIVHAGDERLFITEKSGRIKVLVDGTTYPTPFLNVQSLLSPTPANEEGLLGLAFHPDYPSTPYFYIHYNNPDGDIVIARYSVSANPNVADAGSGVILMTIAHPGQTNHNGGWIGFGPDQQLIASTRPLAILASTSRRASSMTSLGFRPSTALAKASGPSLLLILSRIPKAVSNRTRSLVGM